MIGLPGHNIQNFVYSNISYAQCQWLASTPTHLDDPPVNDMEESKEILLYETNMIKE
jgi:hypothetical protein